MPVEQRPAHSLAIKDFDSHKDEFECWINRFESSVALAHNATEAESLKALYSRWLPLKLDDDALSVYSNVTPTVTDTPLTWDEIKSQLGSLLINPQDRYTWLARRGMVIWDGKESFHALATRLKRNVDKFQPN